MSFKVYDLIIDESVNYFELLAGSGEQPSGLSTIIFTQNNQNITLDTTYQLIELKSSTGLTNILATLPSSETVNQYVTIFANKDDILSSIEINCNDDLISNYIATAGSSSFIVVQWTDIPYPRWILIATNMIQVPP